MGIEQLGQSTQAAIVATKPQQPGVTRASTMVNTAGTAPRHQRDVQTIQNAVQQITQLNASTLEFNTDAETGRAVVKIIDSATGELVRQIPMEEMLALAKSLDQLQGLLSRTKA